MHSETSDGAILFVFGDEAAVAASKAAEATEVPKPDPEPEAVPEAAYEAARAEKVHEGAAATGVKHSHYDQCQFWYQEFQLDASFQVNLHIDMCISQILTACKLLELKPCIAHEDST